MKNFKFAFFSIIVFCILYFIAYITYTFAEPRAYDFMVKHVMTERLPFDNTKNIYGHDDIVLVVIDSKSFERYRWPWKRDLNCKIFEYFLNYAKPKVVLHDAIVTSLDHDSPESDKKFFNTLGKFNNLVEGFMYSSKPFESKEKEKEYNKLFTERYSIKNIKGDGNYAELFNSVITSPIEFLNRVQNLGSITMIPGFINGDIVDQTNRTSQYLTAYNRALFPSLAMKGFLVGNNNPDIIIKKDYFEFPSLNYKIKHIFSNYLETYVVPIKYYNRHYGVYSHKYYSAVDIMDSYDNIKLGKKPVISPEVFKDKYVLIGVNDPLQDGLNDNKKSPVAINHPALDIQATALDNLVHRDFMIILPMWVNILITILGMLLVYYTIRTHRLIKAINYSILIILIMLGISATCFYYGITINVITPVVMCALAIIIGYVHKYVIESLKKQKVQSAMSKYMSEDVMKDVLKNIDNLGLGGKKSVVTVLFSDIRGFTSLSEKMSAQDVSKLLNEYFSAMEPIVSKYNGIINKFIGDAVMAVFGEPIQDENHSLNAVKCGMEMLDKVKELDKKWTEEGKPTIQIGVGINTGEVFVGNIGSEKRMEYTVIGDTVNLASRLESYNKTYKTHILISSSTYEKSKNKISVNKISDVEIRGKAEKMDIYEVTNIVI